MNKSVVSSKANSHYDHAWEELCSHILFVKKERENEMDAYDDEVNVKVKRKQKLYLPFAGMAYRLLLLSITNQQRKCGTPVVVPRISEYFYRCARSCC